MVGLLRNVLRNGRPFRSWRNIPITLVDLRHKRSVLTNGEGYSADCDGDAVGYFSFTKSSTKIAHIPTVVGNCTKEASRRAPPLGRKYVAAIMARAVSTPRGNLLFQFMCVRLPSRLGLQERQRLYTCLARPLKGEGSLYSC